MNRRVFLKYLGTLATVAALPAVAFQLQPTPASIWGVLDGSTLNCYAPIHPGTEEVVVLFPRGAFIGTVKEMRLHDTLSGTERLRHPHQLLYTADADTSLKVTFKLVPL